MHTFFSYYGSKWRLARYYGPPRCDPLIEPFAGGAGYATYWSHPNVHLYDKNEGTCAAWDWLTKCSADDVLRLPDEFRSNDDLMALPDGPRQVVAWNIGYGEGGKPPSFTLRKWYKHFVETGEKIGRLATHATGHKDGHVAYMWGPRVKRRIVQQKPLIKNWTITQCSYEDIPNTRAHWHVDPPYQGKPGRAYAHNDIDYRHLAQWCREREGSVDVCENEGADWLDFKLLTALPSMNSANRSREVVWRNEPVQLTDLM